MGSLVLVGDPMRELGMEETELRLGLPGGAGAGDLRKRGFQEMDLMLNLVTTHSMDKKNLDAEKMKQLSPAHTLKNDPAKPPAPKAQVVGWPPVRSYRKSIMAVHTEKVSNKEEGEKPGAQVVVPSTTFVKVSMDGAPYLRKVDLKMYGSYLDLSSALEKMFSSFTSGSCGSQGTRDFMNENKLMDLLNGSEYVPTYEDKDGDWMLVGDVPWEMFVDSCKRLRIMKGSEAIGLAPRAMEKCKNRN